MIEAPQLGRPKAGRPASPASKVRSNRIVTYVTNGELKKLERIADRERKSLSSVVHERVFRASDDTR